MNNLKVYPDFITLTDTTIFIYVFYYYSRQEDAERQSYK